MRSVVIHYYRMKACPVDLGVKAIDDVCGYRMSNEEAGLSAKRPRRRSRSDGFCVLAPPSELRRRSYTSDGEKNLEILVAR